MKLDLQDASGVVAYHVERIWTVKGTRLKVTSADGSSVPHPQKLLDSFVDAVALNPIEWLRKRPQDQVDDVLRVCGVEPPVAAVTAITGEVHKPQEHESASQYLERLSADELGLYYIRRREEGRRLSQKEKALKEFGPVLDGDEAEADISGLLAERTALDQKREQRRAVQADVEAKRANRDGARNLLKTRQAELEQANARVAALEKQLAQERAVAADLQSRVERGGVVCSDWNMDVDAAEAALALLPDPGPRIAEVERQIQDADKNRQANAERKQARETYQRLSVEAEQARRDHARLELQLAALRELRLNLLNDVDLGVRGLEVGDGELRLDDVSFKQASQAQKIAVACAIAFKRSPRLKILRVDDCEHLDSDSKETLLRLARERNFQCFLSFVRDQREMAVDVVEEE